MSQVNDDAPLIGILQLAYSGELAAAYAYRGHWKSLSDPEERHRIEEIENEEWHHRRLVGEMLRSLNAAPDNRENDARRSSAGYSVFFAMCRAGWRQCMARDGWRVETFGSMKLRLVSPTSAGATI